jgi:hypothetical protein
MATARSEWPSNPTVGLRDQRVRTAHPTVTSSGQFTDSGTETMFLGATGIYPLGVSPAYQNQIYPEKPARFYDVRHCRALSVSISTFNMSTAATVIQFWGSNDGLGATPLFLYDPVGGVFTSSFALPAGGTATAPTGNLFIFDRPWFAYMQVRITAADTGPAATGILTVFKRA